MSKRQTMIGRQSRVPLTFWQRLILVGAVLLSVETLALVSPSQVVYNYINCVAGNGGNGGNGAGGQNPAAGGPGGDCVIGGQKTFSPGGVIQNNGNSGSNQTSGSGAS